MALNLIPPTQQKKPRSRKGRIGSLALKKAREPQKLIYIGIFVIGIILAFFFYGIIKSYQSSLSHKLINLKDQNTALESEIVKLRETTGVAGFQTKLDIIDSIIKSHLSWSGVLKFLQDITLPKVVYTDFSANSNRTLRLNGITVNFTTLAEQIILFKNSQSIKSFKLSTFNISGDGIRFSMDIKLSDDAWRGGNSIK